MGRNGVTRVVQNAITYMDKSDIEVNILGVIAIDEATKKQFNEMGCEVYFLARKENNLVSYIRNLIQIIRKGKYDIVHINCNSCTATIELLAAYIGGAKVRIAHSHNTSCEHNIVHKILRPFFDKLCTDRFACGKEAGQWLYQNRDFVVWNNAVDTDLFCFKASDREEIRERYKLDGKVAVGHVANFFSPKNHSFLLDVWKEVVAKNNNYRLFLIGSGGNHEEYEQRVKDMQLQDSVVFTGSVQDVQKYLCAMDIMVLPSLYEGLPCVVIEWQCAGLPTLIADTVTPDCKLTNLVSFLPLEKEKWVESILSMKPIENRDEQSKESIKEITLAGYSAKENSQQMKQYYISALENRG